MKIKSVKKKQKTSFQAVSYLKKYYTKRKKLYFSKICDQTSKMKSE